MSSPTSRSSRLRIPWATSFSERSGRRWLRGRVIASNCFTRPLAWRAAFRTSSAYLRAAWSESRLAISKSQSSSTPVRTLLKSCATPAASLPKDSSLAACCRRSWTSGERRISSTIANTDPASPFRAGTLHRVQRREALFVMSALPANCTVSRLPASRLKSSCSASLLSRTAMRSTKFGSSRV